jgi:hypothetical protein
MDVESFREFRIRAQKELGKPPRIQFDIEWVVIDDTGGADPEIEQLRFLPNLRVVTPPFNLGHQRAIVHGLRTISNEIRDEDFVITADSDGEDRPEDLHRLLECLLKNEKEVRSLVLARRTQRKETLLFRVCYFFYKLFFRTLTGTVIMSGNFAAFRGWFVNNALFHPTFELSYSSSLVWMPLKKEYVPCARGTRYFGQSKMGYFKRLLHGVRLLMPFLDRVALRAILLSTGAFVFSASLGIIVLIVKFATNLAIPGWTSTILGLAVISSLVALGNFTVLFAVFYQSQSSALQGLDGRSNGESTRRTFKDAA